MRGLAFSRRAGWLPPAAGSDMVAFVTMTNAADQIPTDYTRLPEMGAGVFTAPLQRPAHVGEDWLEPAQRR